MCTTDKHKTQYTELDDTAWKDHDISGLHIAMNDAVSMQVLEALEHTKHDVGYLLSAQELRVVKLLVCCVAKKRSASIRQTLSRSPSLQESL